MDSLRKRLEKYTSQLKTKMRREYQGASDDEIMVRLASGSRDSKGHFDQNRFTTYVELLSQRGSSQSNQSITDAEIDFLFDRWLDKQSYFGDEGSPVEEVRNKRLLLKEFDKAYGVASRLMEGIDLQRLA